MLRILAKLIRLFIPPRFRPIGYLEHVVETNTGRGVAAGPFTGLRYIKGAVGSAYIPKLLGIYERELNGCVEKACALNFPLIVDVGAAEGYYAVGLARRNPKARVIAFEMEEKGRAKLAEMAQLNGIDCMDMERRALARQESASPTSRASVRGSGHSGGASISKSAPAGAPASSTARSYADGQRAGPEAGAPQLELHGKCEFENLQSALASADRSLVVCDVEGYEDVLLVPEKIPALARAHLLVEMHDFCCPGITERITARFAATHRIERIWQEPRTRADLPYRTPGMALLPGRYLDWAVSEWRPERMSWLWMEPKQ